MGMKDLPGAAVAIFLIGFGGNGFAKDNGNSAPPPAPVHHSASAPVTAPIGGGVPHNSVGGALPHNLSGPTSYRPMTTVTGSGQRTLIYPGVRNSTIHQPTGSNLNTVRTGGQQGSGKRGSQSRAGVVTKTSNLNAVHTGASPGSGKLHSPSGIATISKTKLDPQTSTRLRNWGGGVSTTTQARQLNANNHHHHHDHNWWRHHCAAIIFFDSGWWGWYDGWWYPAWGYDPYSNYEYNEPIYGDVAPEQIVAGVQAELQRRGYYTYAIDGKMGPLTRAALARYQTDHRMNITSGIDPATLNALGIVR